MTNDDDVVFESLRARVLSGEYLDERLGPPGADSGAAIQSLTDEGLWQTVYFRGTPEYDTALASGGLEPLPPLTPATEDMVRECEGILDRPLPPLLRRCYLELGNGGFGPGYGLFPLWGSTSSDSVIGLLKKKVTWPRAWQPMSETLLPLCSWGCGIESLVDCRNPSGGMWAIDPNEAPLEEPDAMLFPESLTFAEWMSQWIEGTLQQPCLAV